jgi:MFS family permease
LIEETTHNNGTKDEAMPDMPRFQLLRALKSRNYRLFFFGQSVSLIGTLMQQVALSWLVYRLTGSAVLLGVVGFVSHIPTFLLAPVAGVLSDRWNRRRIILITQCSSLLQASVLAALVLTDHIQIWQLIVLSLVLGLINSFDWPVRHAYLVDMVERKEDLGNAIALNSTIYNSARLIGPPVAGLLVATAGEGICFVINAASFLAVIIAVAAMRIKPAVPVGVRNPLMQELRDGIVYAYGFSPIRAILTLLGVVGLMGMPYAVLLPVFAKDILGGGPETYGFLMTAVGVGSLICTFYMASRRSVLGLGRIIGSSAALFGVGLVCFSLSRNLTLSLVCLALAGAGAMAHSASSNTIIQTIVADDKRGRVMSLYTMLYSGTTPLGNLAAGVLAEWLGSPAALCIGGIACLAGGVYFAGRLPLVREGIRPIYQSMGILPAAPPAVQESQVS